MCWPILAICAVLVASYAVLLVGHVGMDFKIIQHDLQLFKADQTQLYRPDVVSSMVGFVYPPPSLLLFVPFSLVPEQLGYWLYATTLIVAMAAALTLWLRLMRREIHLPPAAVWTDWAALLAVGLTARPMYEAVSAGQIDPVVLLLCVSYLTCMAARRPALAGGLLAVGCWIKIYPALLLIDVLRSPTWRRCLAGFIVTGLAIPLLALPMLPVSLYVRYLTQALPALSSHAITNIYNQSAPAFLARLTVPMQENVQLYLAHPVGAMARFGVLLVLVAGVAAMTLAAKRQPRDRLLLAASLMALIAPVAPLGWGHTYLYVLPLLSLTSITAICVGAWGTLVASVAVLLVFATPPHHRFGGLDFLPQVLQDVLYTRYLFATLVLLPLAWRLRGIAERAQPTAVRGWAEQATLGVPFSGGD